MKSHIMILIITIFLSCGPGESATKVRKSALAGTWYSANPSTLKADIDELLKISSQEEKPHNPKILILPHAGYRYSGKTAAIGYNLISGETPGIIVLLGPSHHSSFRGCSILPVDFYETPLGRLNIAKDIAGKLLKKKNFQTDPGAHSQEHSIEIHLPFLQRIFKNSINKIKILPVLVGTITSSDAQNIADDISDAIKGKGSPLFIISSDFTHYGPRFGYVPFSPAGSKEKAKKLHELDYGAINYILKKDTEGFMDYIGKTGITICGRMPILIGLHLGIKALESKLLAYDTSGNITGDFNNSVSYAAIAMSGNLSWKSKGSDGDDFVLSDNEKAFLLTLARNNIKSLLFSNKLLEIDSDKVPGICREKRGAFVTLNKNKNLRGCIGYIEGIKPLYQTVLENSFNAAFRDHRFQPLQKDEFKEINIEISVLTKPRLIKSIDEIKVGRDGLIIVNSGRKGVLLPQVPVEWGWDRDEFLENLCRKAGLPREALKDKNTRISRFEAIVFSEDGHK